MDLEFVNVCNLYGKHLNPNKVLVMGVLTVNVEGWTGNLFKYNETENKGEVEPDWVYWVRNERGLSREYNDVRQAVAARIQKGINSF